MEIKKVIILKLSSFSVYRFSLHHVNLTDTNAGAQTNMDTVSQAGFSDNHCISHPYGERGEFPTRGSLINARDML